MTRSELADLLEEMQDRDGPDFTALVRELEEHNRMLQRLHLHTEIECENDRHYREWKHRQEAC